MFYLNFTFLFVLTIFRIVCGDTEWIPYEGKEYFASINRGNFSFAQNECKTRASQLAILHHNGRYLHIRNWLNDNADRNSSFFINVFRNVTPGAFSWGDETLFPVGAKWGPGEPTQSRTEDGPFRCVAMSYENNKFWMNDVLCNDVRYNYLCERDIVLESHSWSEWSSWSSCSSSCSPGTRARQRSCVDRNPTGGSSCFPITTGTERESCNTDLCNATTTSTTPCNGSCGETSYLRSFLVCQFDQRLPEECNDVNTISCRPSCTETTYAVYNTPESSPQVTTPKSTTPESSSDAPFKLPIGPIVGGTVVGIVLLFFLIVFFCIFVTSRRRINGSTGGKDKSSHSQQDSVKSLNNTYEAVKFINKPATLDERPKLPERSPMRRNGSLPEVNVSFKPHKHTSNGDCKIKQQKPINKHLILERSPVLKRASLTNEDKVTSSGSTGRLQNSPVKYVNEVSNSSDVQPGNGTRKTFSSHTFPRAKSHIANSTSKSETTDLVSSQQITAKVEDASALADYITVTIPKSEEQAAESEIRTNSFVISSDDATTSAGESQNEQVASHDKSPSLEFDYITVERVVKDQNKEYDKVQQPKQTNEHSSYSYDSLLPR